MSPNGREKSTVSPWLRGWNIAFRTGHITSIAALFGGHVFGTETGRLMPWLYASILTGILLAIMEWIPDRHWFVQARGILSISKILILCLVPFLWNHRVSVLVAIIVAGSFGSHMPYTYRHYPVFGRHPREHG
jgi:hypothetical protein